MIELEFKLIFATAAIIILVLGILEVIKDGK